MNNITNDYPPTLLIHGTQDTDVPYGQSVMMAEQLEEHGIEFKLISIPGAEHGLGGGDPQLIAEAYENVLRFMNQKTQISRK